MFLSIKLENLFAIILGVLSIGFIVLYFLFARKHSVSLKAIVESAILISLAFVLDVVFKLIPFLRMPYGGHATLSMLVLIIIGLRNGPKYGLISGFAYAIINFMSDGFFWHLGSILFDYIIAYTFMGLSGFFSKKAYHNIWYLLLAIFIPIFIRYISSSLSGVLFFSEYAYMPEELNWNVTGTALIWVYSFIIYNGPYMALSLILSIVVGVVLYYRHTIYASSITEEEVLYKQEK